MGKVTTYLAGGAVAAVAALAAIQPAAALPIASGSFSTKAVSGSFAVDTGDINSTTSAVTEASLAVLAVKGGLASVIAPNNGY
jgi:hypothetical protein